MQDPISHTEQLPPPELELGAAETLVEQAKLFSTHAQGVCRFVERIAPDLRESLRGEICELELSGPVLNLGAVDSSQQALRTAGICSLLVAAFRTSSTESEDQRFAQAQLDSSFDVDNVARVIRSHLECELLTSQSQGADHLLILDNSFLSLVESGSRVLLALEHGDPEAMTDAVMREYADAHLGVEGSFVRMMRNRRVVALPKVAGAHALVRELFGRIGLTPEERRSPAALAQNDRVILRHCLSPGEYLAPRPLIADPPTARSAERFFHRKGFGARAELLEHYGAGRPDDDELGLDFVYFRPRRTDGARQAPVLRVELHRAVARREERLHKVLASLEASLDDEHPEPVPQLLADYLAKSAVRHAPAAIAHMAWCDLMVGEGDAPTARQRDIALSIFEEARS